MHVWEWCQNQDISNKKYKISKFSLSIFNIQVHANKCCMWKWKSDLRASYVLGGSVCWLSVLTKCNLKKSSPGSNDWLTNGKSTVLSHVAQLSETYLLSPTRLFSLKCRCHVHPNILIELMWTRRGIWTRAPKGFAITSIGAYPGAGGGVQVHHLNANVEPVSRLILIFCIISNEFG